MIGTWGDEENPSDDYDCGHLIGPQLGGWGGRANIIPQNSNFNRGNSSQLESKMATCSVLHPAFMRYSIEVEYPNQATLIPSAFAMTITRQQDGLAVTLRFENVRSGGID